MVKTLVTFKWCIRIPGHPSNTAVHSADLLLDPRSTQIILNAPYEEH